MNGRKAKQQRRLQQAGLIPPTPGAPWSVADLDGGRLVKGYRLRQARPEDWPRVRELIGLTGALIAEEIGQSMLDERAARQIRAVLDGGLDSGFQVMSEYLQAQDLESLSLSMTSTIVAETNDDGLAGACVMMPAAQPIQMLMRLGAELPKITMMFVAVKKLGAVAVDEFHQRHGLGAALVLASTSLVRQIGATVIYGQFEQSRHLAEFYRKCGFEVLDPDVGFDLEWLLDIRYVVAPVPGEQIFVQDGGRGGRTRRQGTEFTLRAGERRS